MKVRVLGLVCFDEKFLGDEIKDCRAPKGENCDSTAPLACPRSAAPPIVPITIAKEAAIGTNTARRFGVPRSRSSAVRESPRKRTTR